MFKWRMDLQRHPGFDVDWAAFENTERSYREFLRQRDLAGTGDLLLYFGADFFRHAGISGISFTENGRNVVFALAALVVSAEPREWDFTAEFENVVWIDWWREPSGADLGRILSCEIDGLDERLTEAGQQFGSGFHSLTISCLEGWLCLIFRSVRVTAERQAEWLDFIRNPEAKPGLYGVD